uniref:RHOMBOID-like protein 12, mitochondrial n=1 Tax=Erigeron canadensis TaxID=72917 RepID=UPI001CB890AA|nr:RHOMBOID-like protein 12, mitochondrial [Erigeron canadensis]
MHKLFSFKLISKNPSKFASKTIRSNPISHQKTSNLPPNHHYHVFTNYTTVSPKMPTNCLMKVLSNPCSFKQFLPNGLMNSRKLVVGFENLGLLRAYFSKYNFQIHRPTGYRNTWLSQFRRKLTTEGVVIGLIVTNVAVFMLWKVADRRFMVQNFMISLDNFKSGRFHTLITSAFSHYDVGHVVSNMIGLYFFGMSIGHQFGPEFLLKLYLAGAVAGSVFYLVQHAYLALSSKERRLFERDPSNIPALGASGAVNAIMLLDLFLNPTKTVYLEFIIPVPAILLGIFLVGHDMVRILEGNTQISGSAHLGGAAVAALAWARLRRGRF